MAKRNTPAYDPRRIWSTNLAPLVTAAREGASHAAQTAGKERERARQRSWLRRRWLYVSAAGLVVAGAAGGVYRAAAKRSATAPDGTGAGPEPAGSTAAETIRSTVETGREKLTEVARTMVHKIRREEPDQPDQPAAYAPAPAGTETGSQPRPAAKGAAAPTAPTSPTGADKAPASPGSARKATTPGEVRNQADVTKGETG